MRVRMAQKSALFINSTCDIKSYNGEKSLVSNRIMEGYDAGVKVQRGNWGPDRFTEKIYADKQ